MRGYEITFRLFGWQFLFTFDVYPCSPYPKTHYYGSTSNFGKWKTVSTTMTHPGLVRKTVKRKKRK